MAPAQRHHDATAGFKSVAERQFILVRDLGTVRQAVVAAMENVPGVLVEMRGLLGLLRSVERPGQTTLVHRACDDGLGVGGQLEAPGAYGLPQALWT
jgi:hypothetical protein